MSYGWLMLRVRAEDGKAEGPGLGRLQTRARRERTAGDERERGPLVLEAAAWKIVSVLLHGMGTGNRSQGKMYWRKAVEYKLANNAKKSVIDRLPFWHEESAPVKTYIACRSSSSRPP